MNITKDHPSTWTAMRCANEAGASLRYHTNSDAHTSSIAGAEYLTGVVTDVLERIESDPDGEDHTHMAADACIPVYTHAQWDTFHDLYAWTEDLTELGGPEDDMTKNATAAIYLIGCRLAGAVIEALEEG
jgi:hypothetical protein